MSLARIAAKQSPPKSRMRSGKRALYGANLRSGRSSTITALTSSMFNMLSSSKIWIVWPAISSDLSCQAEPPMGSILYLHQTPEVGGDTAFANMYLAYDTLSEPIKKLCDGLTALHTSA